MAAKLATSRTHTAAFPSPETSPQGWCSERVPLSSHRHGRRSHAAAAAALMPFGSGSGSGSGRAFPSKWDDAERWISSPATAPNYYYATGVAKAPSSSQLGYRYQRRAKSKSGPLGPTGLTSYGSFNGFSPVLGMGVINGGRWRNSVTVESTASVQDRLEEGAAASGGGRRSCPSGHPETDWLDLWSEPPSPTIHHQAEEQTEMQEKKDEDENGEGVIDRVISRRDMATQMYPEFESSCPSSMISTPRSSISDNSPHPLMHDDELNVRSPDYEYEQVRDVQVDKQTSTSRRRSSSDNEEFNDNPGLSASFIEADNRFSKLEKEGARIKAWENLQKAKAESAIQKLEMKLEKKRASAMEKIIKKLRRAETKAEKMRNSHEAQNNAHVSRSISKIPSFCRKIRLTSSTKNCTTCYPF